ncbi:NB-ARC domains-containing protein [Tanacetum coccineum]
MVVKQVENYEATFCKHEKLVKQDVSNWKEALIKAVSLPGWDLQRLANGYESKFIDMISKHIFNELNVGSLHVGEKIVGVHSRAKEMNLLQFVGSSKGTPPPRNPDLVCGFCEDVNDFVKKFGMVQLQRQIIEDMTKEDLKISSAGEGSNAMKKIMLSKKVLLILDDVHERDHLEALAGSHGWFGSGSLILITGKDRQLLIAHGVEKVYDVELLHDDEAMELFNLKTVCEWESELWRLERYPTDDIQVLISRFSLNKKRKDS